MPSDIKAGIVLVNAFTTGGSDSYNAYIDYIDRNEATRNTHYNEFVIKDLKKDGSNLNNANGEPKAAAPSRNVSYTEPV